MTRLLPALAALAVLALLALPAAAQETPCPMTYAEFLFAVPTVALPECPDSLGGIDYFCRATVGNEALHVFAFDYAGEQCLVGVASFPEGAFTLSVE